MDGYSVTEAASVLGVPTERVWELLARGVLSGAPEGDTGMRVFLQPRPRPTIASDDPRRPNGDRGADPEREASPFRELLTEFRGLTERYGQALLALGEARGEVAALRSRVDVLEARMDLRLPMGTGAGTPWPAPAPTPLMQAARSVEAPVESAEPAGEHAEEEEHRIRRRGPRRATESFAEALARAEDPSIPELPAAAAAGEPMAAPRADAAAEGAAEPSLPRELPPAETVPVAEEPETVDADAESAAPEAPPEPEAVEPVAVEEPSEAQPEPAEVEPADEPMVAVGSDMDATAREDAADDQVAVEVEPEPVVADAPEPPPREPEPTDQPVSVDETMVAEVQEAEAQEAEPAEAEPEPVAPEPEPEPVDAARKPEPAEVEPEPVGAAREPVPAPEVELVAEEAEAAPIDFDAARYTTAIEDPDWFEAEVDLEPARTEAEPAPEPVAMREPEPEPETEDELESMGATEPPPESEPEPEPEPEPEVGVEPAEASEPPPEPADPGAPNEPMRAETDTEDEETVLWFGRRPVDASGADEMEVAGSGSAHSAGDSSAATPLPGSEELDEAMAALEELTGRSEGPPPREPDEWPPASAGLAEPPDELATLRSLASPPRVTFGPGARPGSPATRAYRRLRRIFPS